MINFKLRLQNKATLVGLNTFVGILVILGIVTDPTTKGIADSERALNYDVPLNDKKEK